jgi:competence protein ComEC
VLRVHVLDVGHGDAIVLEYRHETGVDFALIDTHRCGDETPKAVRKLQSLGATTLDFIAITHPHADHFSGIAAVLDAHPVRTLLTFPVARHRQRIERLAQHIADRSRQSDSVRLLRQQVDLMRWLQALSTHSDVQEHCGPNATFFPKGFVGVSFTVIAPPARHKGRHFQQIDEGRIEWQDDAQNEISLALLVEYAGVRLVLGGDTTAASLEEIARQRERRAMNVAANVVKLPHHGSRHDCAPQALTSLFGVGAAARTTAPIAIISANGRSHPAPEVLSWLQTQGIAPYCTGLSKACGSGKRCQLAAAPELDPALEFFVTTSMTDESRLGTSQCQGDITVQIDPNGRINVQRQYNALCAFRGDYERLGLA